MKVIEVVENRVYNLLISGNEIDADILAREMEEKLRIKIDNVILSDNCKEITLICIV